MLTGRHATPACFKPTVGEISRGCPPVSGSSVEVRSTLVEGIPILEGKPRAVVRIQCCSPMVHLLKLVNNDPNNCEKPLRGDMVRPWRRWNGNVL